MLCNYYNFVYCRKLKFYFENINNNNKKEIICFENIIVWMISFFVMDILLFIYVF